MKEKLVSERTRGSGRVARKVNLKRSSAFIHYLRCSIDGVDASLLYFIEHKSLFGFNGACFSHDKKYRFALWRIWNDDLPAVMFIGLNPSTANESEDDPTIRRVRNFAKDWGYGGFFMMNLFPLVTPYPGDLWNFYTTEFHSKEDDISMKLIDKVAKHSDRIIFAWGSFKEAEERGKAIMNHYDGYALAVNSDGSPRHPLYVKSNVELKKV